MVFWEGYVSDEVMAIFAPVAVYWLYTGLYHLILPYMDNYRVHTKEEADEKNKVPLSTVVRTVLFLHSLQIGLFYWIVSSKDEAVVQVQPSIPVQLMQFIISMFVTDTWNYWFHRAMHTKFFYRHVHSLHHRCVVPYPIATNFQHPFESFFGDLVGGSLGYFISGMTPRTSVYYFCLFTIKGVDDHCGILIPGNPLHWIFNANAAFHDTHHQLKGIKSNFSVPYFNFWDKIFGTYAPYKVVKRPEGGFEVKLIKND